MSTFLVPWESEAGGLQIWALPGQLIKICLKIKNKIRFSVAQYERPTTTKEEGKGEKRKKKRRKDKRKERKRFIVTYS